MRASELIQKMLELTQEEGEDLEVVIPDCRGTAPIFEEDIIILSFETDEKFILIQ